MTYPSHTNLGGIRSRDPQLRILIGAILLVASAYAWLNYAVTFSHPGAIGLDFNAVGADWMVFHSAARLYLNGDWATVYDGHRFTAYLNENYRDWLSSPLDYRPWVYPPTYLLLLVPFGPLGFAASYVAFQLLTAMILIAALVLGNPQKQKAWILAGAAILNPAAAYNLAAGQNVFLIAGLLVAGFRLLKSAPILGGVVLGLLTIKPQFALMAPIALLAARQWRALFAAAWSAIFLAICSAAIFGADAWTIWLRQITHDLIAPDGLWIQAGRMWGVSTWTCAVLLGAPPSLASILQFSGDILAAGVVAVAFWPRSNERARLPILLTATLFAAPHWNPYDAVLIALAGVLWLCERKDDEAAPWLWIMTLALWIAPLIMPPVLTPLGRAIPALIVAFMVAALREQRHSFLFGRLAIAFERSGAGLELEPREPRVEAALRQ
jgi:alpha-1,2-mannosyltransferase